MAAHLVWKPSKRKDASVANLRFWFGDRKFFRSLKTTDETVANAKLWRANETLRRLDQGVLDHLDISRHFQIKQKNGGFSGFSETSEMMRQ